ncbi:MAG: hypothetical protein GC185_01695 [Alphaproteobacteria bacterium]|nr:hypothetical protein [Alphaproteobacteria bacterium]
MPKSDAAIHKEDIKAAVHKRGESFYSLCRKAGLSKNAIAVSFHKPVPAAHQVLSKFLDIPVQKIWPQWYDANGKRIPSRSTSKHSAKRMTAYSKKNTRHLTKNAKEDAHA